MEKTFRIENGCLYLTIARCLKGYGSTKMKDEIIKGSGDGSFFEFEKPLDKEVASCLPGLVKVGTHYPTQYFSDVYKRKEAVKYNSAIVHVITEYD